jgi:hypothetical protein
MSSAFDRKSSAEDSMKTVDSVTELLWHFGSIYLSATNIEEDEMNSVNGGRVIADLRLNVEGEITILEVVKQVKDGSVRYVVFVDGGSLPSGDQFLAFDEVGEAMVEFAKQAKLVVEIIEEVL